MMALFLRDLKLSVRAGGGALIGVLFFTTQEAKNHVVESAPDASARWLGVMQRIAEKG